MLPFLSEYENPRENVFSRVSASESDELNKSVITTEDSQNSAALNINPINSEAMSVFVKGPNLF